MDQYLRLSGVKGNSKAAGYAGWIELLEHEVGPKPSHGGTGSGVTISTPTYLMAKFREDSNYSSRIAQLAMSGALIPDGELDLYNGTPQTYLGTYRFTGLSISSYEVGGGDAPFQRATFLFQSIKFENG
ncbi:hypothetical protein F183_A04700 [Bryobacterales bacterium F-183]|nr:hypothetical protein F183_A04700 [Bryobacterales bacterium F-183]